MADNPLLAALLGAQVRPQETPFGVGAEAIGAIAPNLYNPYASTGRNLGAIAGAGLLAGLMGYQARREAEAETRALMPRVSELLAASSPEAIGQLAGAEGFPSQLMPLAQKLMLTQATAQQEAAAKRAAKLAELQSEGEFELGPVGTELFERNKRQQLELIEARNALLGQMGGLDSKPKKDWIETLGQAQRDALFSAKGNIESIRGLANQFRSLEQTRAELEVAHRIPGTAANLAWSKLDTMIPGIAKQIGQLGNLNIYEQQILDRSMRGGLAGSQTIAERLEQLANLAEKKARETAITAKVAAEAGGDAVLRRLGLEAGETTAQIQEAIVPQDIGKQEVLRQLQQEAAELRALLANRKAQ